MPHVSIFVMAKKMSQSKRPHPARSPVTTAKSEVDVEKIFTLTQFLLDCSSHNLENNVRIAACDPTVEDIFVQARHIINAIHCERIRKIKLVKTTPG